MAKRNIHTVDRLLRVLIAEWLGFIGYFLVPPQFEMLLYALAVILMLNALVGISSIYILLDINTRENYAEKKWLEGILIYLIIFLPLFPLYRTGGSIDLDGDLMLATIIGFIAQLIDGSLGMAYGVTSSALLIGFGVPPVISSASIHTAEIVTSGASGVAHLRAGNVDRGVLKYLVISGVIGAIIGATILTNVPGEIFKPFISIYLLIMGVLLIEKAFEKKPLIIKAFIFFRDKLMHGNQERWGKKLMPFGFVGGFLDSIGGGGWGPVLTLTLFFRGENLRQAIGSVNFAEFFVSIAASATLFAYIKFEYWQTILGLIIGGLLAVPLGPWVTSRLPLKPLMIMVGILVSILSLKNISEFFLAQF